ncbi:metal-binding (seleno)protein [Deferrisoma sp.]
MRRIGFAALMALLVLGVLAASSPTPAGAESRTAVLRVEGMTCAACTFAVKAALQKVEGVEAAEVSFREKKAVVTYDPARTSQKVLIEAVESTGFRAAPLSEGGETR